MFALAYSPPARALSFSASPHHTKARALLFRLTENSDVPFKTKKVGSRLGIRGAYFFLRERAGGFLSCVS